jgi:EpsI family protein
MTTKLAILLAVLLGGLSSVFLLPKQLGYQPVGVKMELPQMLGGWYGTDAAITEKEKEVLVDADFARKYYSSGRGDRVLVSIVLAGQDMMTGIHRPERCLQAQGWNSESSSRRAIRLANGETLGVTRLRNTRKFVQEGKSYTIRNLAYYWFVGANSQAATHEGRIAYDVADRIIRGYNQRWAMVLVSAEILQREGLDEPATDKLLEDVIARVATKIRKEKDEG